MFLFLRRILLFLIVPFSVVIITYLYKLNITQIKLKEIAENYSILIMGDSHMARINPLLVKGNTYNLASAGEHYFYTYSKLRTILKDKNNKVNTIILGVAPHNFAPVYQKLYDLNSSEGKTNLQQYLFFIDLFHCREYNLLDFIKSPSFYKAVFSSPNWGGWFVSKNANPALPVILTSLSMHYDDEKKSDSTLQAFYLNEITNDCIEKGISLVMVSTPVHREYKKRMPLKYLNLNEEITKKYSHSFLYADYFSSNMPDEFFSDGDHLNDRGAEIISMKIDSLILKKRNSSNH